MTLSTTSRHQRRPIPPLSLAAALLAGILLAGTTSLADTGDLGFEGPSFTGIGTTPTGQKPESKLWWNDGFWWASMFDTLSKDFHIFRLDEVTETWIDTGTLIDERVNTNADCLWDGTHLYIASHVFSTSPASGFPGRLYRYSYDSVTDTYTLDTGFPVLINDMRTETLVIGKDSTGRLWATWTQDNTVYVNRTLGSDLVWGTPFIPPVSGTALNPDDISSLVAFGGDRIGLMWSNQAASAMYFAVHLDSKPDTVWEASRTALQGPGTADDHINLKSLQSDGSGRVFAAVKTSFDTPGSAPLIMLLVRAPADGSWTSSVFGRVADSHTRPIVLLDEDSGTLHMFATGPQPPSDILDPGGTIYEKSAPIDAISFPLGYGTPVILDASTPQLNNATSTKQNLNGRTGIVVLAGNNSTERYWHLHRRFCTPDPSGETCDGRDNDCDSLVDEDFPLGEACTVGIGACAATGVTVCSADGAGTVCGAVPGSPAPDDSLCNGIDDDCDGSVDEEFAPAATACGVGACAASGATTCVAGVLGDTCTPGAPSPETCNGIDDDCNGLTDDLDADRDGFLACVDDCDDTDPFVHPGAAEVCNGNDDDCNLLVDEDVLGVDTDSDGVHNTCDNCVQEPNRDQGDIDQDGEGDVCDLDDGLIWIGFPDAATVGWQDEAGFRSFNLYRGDLALLKNSGIYTQSPDQSPLASRDCNIRDVTAPAGSDPPPGAAVFWLVTGNAGSKESSLGTDSSGTERPNTYPCR